MKLTGCYHSLLEWHYGDKWGKSLTAKERVGNEGLSIWEMEHCMEVEMFLDEYLHWEAEGLHHPLILQMFSKPPTLGEGRQSR